MKPMLRRAFAMVLLAALSLPSLAGELFPFVMPWDDASATLTNLSAWNEKPAGKHGFVRVEDGHLFAGKERLRLLGVNIVFGSVAPDHATADKLAARMARFGINVVRFHHMDSRPAPDGLLQKDMRTLDAGMLERMDYFIAALKREGIYSNLNLHVGRKYPGFKDWGEDTPKYWKGVDNFYPPMIAIQQEFARDLLLHRNPYTGNRYVEEPAVALIEINNENGLLREWRLGSLNAMTEPYRGELQGQWQSWLKKKYKDSAGLRAAWGLREEALGAEMLGSAANVKSSEAGWNLQLVESAKASLSKRPEGGLDLAITAPSRENWHTQLHQNRLSFKADQPYTLTLRLRADKPLKLALQAMQAHAPWQHLWDQTIEVGTAWQDVKITFAPSQGDELARFTLSGLGQLTGRLQIASASLRPGGVLGLKAGESLEAGTVDIIGSGDLMSRTRAGQQDWIQFLWDVENGYWRGFQTYLRELALSPQPAPDGAVSPPRGPTQSWGSPATGSSGAMPLIVGTQVSYSPAPIQAALDVVDGHAYWQHPNFPGKPWDMDNWRITNSPLAGLDGAGTLADLALRRVPGKPFIVTEYNHSNPSHYQGEALPLAAAYGALQDWDGIFLYSFGAHDKKWDSGMIDRFFDSHANPVKMASFLSAAALFRRGDIRAAKAVTQALPPQQAWIDALRASYKVPGADSFGAPRNSVLQGAVNITTPAAAAMPLPVKSETGELVWGLEGVNGKTVVIDSPRSKGLIGARLGKPYDAHGVELELLGARNDWGVLLTTLIEGRDFTSPGRVLVSALGQVENTGQRWLDEKKTTVGRNFGSAPTVVEGLAARITLPVAASRVRAWALDERGNRREEIKVTGSERATLEIGAAWRTLWYEIEVR